MGADKRPARSSKVRAMERVSLQQQSEEDDLEAERQLQCHDTRPRRSNRSNRRTVIIDSDDEEPHQVHQQHHDDDPDHLDHDPKSFVQYNAPTNLAQHSTDESQPHDDDDDDDDDANDEEPLNNIQSYLKASSPKPAPAGVVTKYGRHVRPRQLSPVITPPTRTRRSAAVAELPTSREQRMERARRRTKSAAEFQYRPETESVRLRARVRQARPSYSLNEADDDDFDDEEEVIMEGNEDSAPTPMQARSSRVIRSRVTKIESRNGHRRVSTRKKNSTNQIEAHIYEAKDAPLSNGIAKATRTSTRQSRYLARIKESGEEEDDDGDFQSPGTGEESDDHDLQDAALPEDQDALDGDPHAEDSDMEEVPRRSRRTSSRRTRKTQPQRTVRRKVKGSTKSQEREENPIAREARKSYRPRNESLRPSDYYAEAESSSEDSSSGRDFGISTRLRPKRAAASRAGDAIANKLDYLQNPMAVEGALPKRPRPGRYDRRKSRLRPAGNDPFPSDDDVLGPTGAAGIEPIQVDLKLSWDDVGGLDHHVRALKEMVALPLMYPEIFEKFDMEPPKGVLFYGPPGTGKTLCARALAASCGADTEATSADMGESAAMADITLGVPDANQPTSAAPAQQFSGNPSSVEKSAGEVNEKQLRPDVIMTDSPTEETKVMAQNGAPSGQDKAEGVIAAAAATRVGPASLVAEHAAVVNERAAGLQSRVPVQDATMTPPDSRGPTDKRPGNPVDDKLRVKKKPRVAFFMRNGADCLSKWVGEAERHLRMTFEAAKKHQPSIIFFDEIDGLAPVRSSRQDQIHSSIVSTLLGLMDGLDARGKIVVIGATNRVDAIDPALRRPGRFDRELIFTLPNVQARRKILGIHTSKWSPPPDPEVLDTVASMTVGYCGADLKALCTESAIRALRRRYPQIYASREKLVINVDEVNVKTRDFLAAMKEIVPASHRSARTHARPITARLREILNAPLESCIAVLKRIFPQGIDSESARKLKESGLENRSMPEDDNMKEKDNDSVYSSSDDDYDVPNLSKAQDSISNAGRIRPGTGKGKLGNSLTLRPRLLICGMQGLGQAQLGPAILHHFEGCPVHAIDYPSLHSDAGARCAEEALVSAFREAMRSVPAILYLPHLDLWWESASPSLRTTLIIALKDLPSDLPLLVLATADTPLNELPSEVTELFGETVELSPPSEPSRKRMFAPLLEDAQAIPRFSNAAAKRLRKKRRTEVLPKAPPPKPKPLTEEEIKQKEQNDDKYIRRLRMEMRNFVETLLRDTRFKAFWYPVDPKSAPDYYDIIKVPMDIAKIAAQNDLGKYPTVLAMVNDFDILVRNAIQYNPPNTETGAAILRRAHGLIDIVHAWVDNLNPAVVETCNKIIGDRVKRKQKEMAVKQASLERSASAEEREDGAAEAQRNAREANGPGDKDKSEGDNAPSTEVEPVDNGSQMNGCADVAVMEAEPARSQELSQQRAEEQEVVPTEAVTVASRSDVMALAKLLLDVSTGVTVDGLESLYMKCVKVLREHRRDMNRDAVVKQLVRTATEARDDPAVVGTLVE